MKSCLGSLITANKMFDLIQNNDKICVGVSGGKDSMLMLHTLAIYKKILEKEQNIKITIIGIHLKMNLCVINYDEIKEYWKKRDIQFEVEDTQIGEILKKNMKKNKLQCSLCSKMKKAILIEAAKKHNCNKVAMGHHADDAIETFFMNMVNEGRLSTFKAKMYMDRTDVWFIRPFILAREQEIIKEAKRLNMPVVPCGCPMESFTQRDYVKEFLSENFYKNKKWKISYKNFLNALLNGKESDLWFFKDKKNNIDLLNKNKEPK